MSWRGEQVDIFAVPPPAQFGVMFVARTGDSSFTQSIYGVARSKGMKFDQGRIVGRTGERFHTPEKVDVFKVLVCHSWSRKDGASFLQLVEAKL